MYLEKLNLIIKDVNKNINVYDLLDLLYENDLMYEIFSEVEKFNHFMLDGRIENILSELMHQRINKMNRKLFLNNEEFITEVESEIKKHVVPIIIIIPINLLDYEIINKSIIFNNENIRIFSYKNEKAISRYLRDNYYFKLLPQHITSTKDKNFFNSPLMTIVVEGIDYNVIRKAPKIVEATYSIIRMISFTNMKRTGQHNFYKANLYDMPSTYTVYYNSPEQNKNKKVSNGYGYSFRKGYSSLIDSNLETIINNKEMISFLLTNFIQYTLPNYKSIQTEETLKWTRALILFNEAYEMASTEKYETANLLLLTILEMFFSKKTDRNKRISIIEGISDVELNIDGKEYEGVINHLYNSRNSFVHEGKEFQQRVIYRNLHDYTGLIPGTEPLSFISENYKKYNKDLYTLKKLFDLVINIIIKKANSNKTGLF